MIAHAEVAQDAACRARVFDEGEHAHAVTALGAAQDVEAEGASHEASPLAVVSAWVGGDVPCRCACGVGGVRGTAFARLSRHELAPEGCGLRMVVWRALEARLDRDAADSRPGAVVLQRAGLEPRTLSKVEALVVVERLLPRELDTRRVANAATVCTEIVIALKSTTFTDAGPESAESAFARLGRK